MPDSTVFSACGRSWRVHPACAVFPLLKGDELAALVADVRAHGLFEAVMVDGDELLDGRNRLLACELAEVEPRFRSWDRNGSSKTAWILSVNLRRRQLSEAQRGALSFDLFPVFEEEARERQREAGRERQRRAAENTDRPNQENEQLGDCGPQAARFDDFDDSAERAPRASDFIGFIVGLSGRSVRRVRAIAKDAPDLLVKLRLDEITISKALGVLKQRSKRRVAAEIAAETAPVPLGPFRVLVIDPPWMYDKRAEDTTHRARLPYPEMSNSEILALDVASLAHADCVLWLWTTNAHMRLALECVERWGFTQKTILTWAKDRFGCGDWLRGQTEHCIMAVRGKPTVLLTNQSTLLHGNVREHSRKPDEFYALVESLCPGSKLELFAREPREGWQSWGAETAKFS